MKYVLGFLMLILSGCFRAPAESVVAGNCYRHVEYSETYVKIQSTEVFAPNYAVINYLIEDGLKSEFRTRSLREFKDLYEHQVDCNLYREQQLRSRVSILETKVQELQETK